jgi:elongation factor Ts
MSKETLIELRKMTGAGIADITNALEEAGDDKDKALELLRKRGIAKAAKKQDREANEGLVASYIHANGRVGVLVEVACETDFVARNEDFQKFVNEIALHIAGANPLYLSSEDVPEEVVEKEKEIAREQMNTDGKMAGKPEEMIEKILEGKIKKYYQETVLLDQESIRDESKTISDLVTEATAKMGEKIEIRRFVRYSIGG